MEITDVRWVTSGFTTIGFVAGIDAVTKEKKIYAGVGNGISANDDIKHIAENGSKVNAQDMLNFFGPGKAEPERQSEWSSNCDCGTCDACSLAYELSIRGLVAIKEIANVEA